MSGLKAVFDPYEVVFLKGREESEDLPIYAIRPGAHRDSYHAFVMECPGIEIPEPRNRRKCVGKGLKVGEILNKMIEILH